MTVNGFIIRNLSGSTPATGTKTYFSEIWLDSEIIALNPHC